MEVPPTYPFYAEYCLLRDLVTQHSPSSLDLVTGTTCHYNLPDFRMCLNGVRVIGIHPRPKGVELLLEFNKFMDSRDLYDQDLITSFEDACGAIIKNKNRLFKLTDAGSVDLEYLETFIATGIPLYMEYLNRTHPQC